MTMRHVSLTASPLAIAVALCCAPAQAQLAPADAPRSPETTGETQTGIADIVVTARRTSESLQRTPVAISAFNNETLERLNVTQVDKMAQVVPNLVISQQSTSLSTASVMIRGVGQTDPSFGLDTRVGIYLDGVYVARSAGSIFDLVDLERIEVLRGPQGTLFGRNTIGGAIQLVSKKPADEFGFTVKAGYGTRENWFGRARVDTGEFGDSGISASATYYHRQRNGWFDNLLTPRSKDPGSLNVDAFSAALRGDWGAFQANYIFDYDDRVGSPVFFQTVALTPAAQTYFGRSASLGGAPLQFVGPDIRLKRGLQQAGRGDKFTSHTTTYGHNLTLTYEASDAFSLRSITGWRRLKLDNVLGLSGQGDLRGVVFDPTSPTFTSVQPVTLYNGVNPQKATQFSEELQAFGDVGDFHYVLGAYYFRERTFENNQQNITVVLPGATFGLSNDFVGLNLQPTQRYRARSTSYAAFGQLSWKPAALDERLELTGGIRYTEDRKRLNQMNTSFGVPDATNGRDSDTFTNTSFLASTSYQITPTILVYAKVSTGYASGGFNPRAPGQLDAQGRFIGLNSYDPEKLTSYEIGAKTDLLDRRLRINVAAFYSDYKDLQVPQFASGTGGATTLLVNAGKAVFKGVELEVTALPTRGLTLSGSLGYTEPKYKQFLFRDPVSGTISDVADTARFSAVAKFNSNVAAEYTFEPMDFGALSVRGSYAYRSHVYFYPNDQVNPFNKLVDSAATNNVEARIALSDIKLGGRAVGEIAAFGENLLNEDQVGYGIDFGGLGFGGKLYTEPRRFGVEFKVSY